MEKDNKVLFTVGDMQTNYNRISDTIDLTESERLIGVRYLKQGNTVHNIEFVIGFQKSPEE